MKAHSLCPVACAILLMACSPDTNTGAPEQFQVIAPLITDTACYESYVAQIAALQNIEVRARVQGFIEDIHVDEGQAVKQGQTLFSISSSTYAQEAQKAKAAVQGAQAELEAARLELANTERLLEKNIVSGPELTAARAKVASLEAAAAAARSDEAQADLNLSFTEVRAPFDGIINRIPYRQGSLVEEGALLTTISNNTEVFAYFNVSEQDYLDQVTATDDVRSKEVTLVLANGLEYPERGVIETSESEFDKSTGNIAFRARFANPKGILKHGGTGKVRVRSALKQAMLVPQRATFEIQGNTYVFVVDKDGKVSSRKVETAQRLPQLFVIHSGLKPDEHFILDGIQRVKDGDSIAPQLVAFPITTKASAT